MLGLALLAAAHTGTVNLAQAQNHASVRIVGESTGAIPGSTTWIGLNFTIESKWHIYWDGQNDSGSPPQTSEPPTLPAGYKLGAWQWPAPQRHVLPGEILDHIYETAVTILIPVEVPKSAKPGEKAKIAFKLRWLECSNVCMFGDAEAQIELPIVADKAEIKPSADAKLFETARKSFAKPLPKDSSVTAAISGGTLSLKAKGPGVTGLAYMPRSDSAKIANLATAGETKGAELALELTPEPGKKTTAWGILEVRREGGKVEHYEVDLGRSAPKPPAGKVEEQPVKAPK